MNSESVRNRVFMAEEKLDLDRIVLAPPDSPIYYCGSNLVYCKDGLISLTEENPDSWESIEKDLEDIVRRAKELLKGE